MNEQEQTPPEPSPIEQVFDYWRQIHHHPRARLDDARKKKINAMLSVGYEVNDLKLAIYGCKYSGFHQGQNEGGTVYDELTLILRDAAHVDKFMAIGEATVRHVEARRRQKAELAPPAQNERGEAYIENRGKLLSLVKKQA